MIELGLSFDDVLLVPQYSEVLSRSDERLDLSADMIGFNLKLPVIASPMSTVSEAEMVVAMAESGGLAVIHRFNTIDEQLNIVNKAKELWKSSENELKIAAAIGVGGDYQQRAISLVESGVDIICVDVAHGHHVLMKEALHWLRSQFKWNIHVMAGNVATSKGYEDLACWGADSVRVGIGNGSSCSTRIQTGAGVPLFTSLQKCFARKKEMKLKTKIIADGGLKNSGDIVKALAAGADAVMTGSLLAGTEESPGEILMDRQGRKRKAYAGMASKRSQETWRGYSSAPEGISTMVEYKGSTKEILENIRIYLGSALSYNGVFTLNDLKEGAVFIRQTPAGQFESSTHILSK